MPSPIVTLTSRKVGTIQTKINYYIKTSWLWERRLIEGNNLLHVKQNGELLHVTYSMITSCFHALSQVNESPFSWINCKTEKLKCVNLQWLWSKSKNSRVPVHWKTLPSRMTTFFKLQSGHMPAFLLQHGCRKPVEVGEDVGSGLPALGAPCQLCGP